MSEMMLSIMNGAKTVMKAQAINANNLANASTTGFKGEIANFISFEDEDSLTTHTDLHTGSLRSTGRDLDVSVNGDGWIAIMTPEGTEGYSRRGDLRVDTFGQLTNGKGQAIMGNGGPIALPPFASLEIGSDGTISIVPQGQNATSQAVVDRIKLVTLDERQLQRGDDGTLRLPDGQVAPADAAVTVTAGTLENSNVNAVAEMIRMIDLSRQFETHVKLLQNTSENASSLASVLRMN